MSFSNGQINQSASLLLNHWKVPSVKQSTIELSAQEDIALRMSGAQSIIKIPNQTAKPNTGSMSHRSHKENLPKKRCSKAGLNNSGCKIFGVNNSTPLDAKSLNTSADNKIFSDSQMIMSPAGQFGYVNELQLEKETKAAQLSQEMQKVYELLKL